MRDNLTRIMHTLEDHIKMELTLYLLSHSYPNIQVTMHHSGILLNC
jgi:hypothetical protein